MSPRSSLLKRAAVPLLAVAAAAAFCAPTRAATATFVYCGASGSNAIDERVKCSMTDDNRWNDTVFNCQDIGGDGSITGMYSFGFVYYGPGDYYGGATISLLTSSKYNCWVICSGLKYDNTAWQASTGGTYYVTLWRPAP